MPRGLCENCGRHDVFVFPVPLAFGRTVFVCARCLNLPQAALEDDEDEDQECTRISSTYCVSFVIPSPQFVVAESVKVMTPAV